MTREEMLNETKKCVCTDRNKQYGEPEDNFGVIAELWNNYLELKRSVDILNATDVANMMILFKMGRAMTASEIKADTYIDLAGYAACACEIETESRNDGIYCGQRSGDM